MKKRLAYIVEAIKKPFIKLSELIKTGLTKSRDFIYEINRRHIYPVTNKIKYALTHNPILRVDGLKIKLFSFITIKVTRKRRAAIYGFSFIAIWIVGFAIFTLYPMFYSFYLSLTESYYNIEGIRITWVGFQNYPMVIRNSTLLPLFINYVGKMVLAVPLIIVFAILISVLINNPIKMKGFWRTIFFLPVVISSGPVINYLNEQEATSLPSLQNSNVLFYIQENLGAWLAGPLETVLMSMLQILWYAGVPILIFLAALQKIDPSVYEAASIDGASPWDRFWKITLPSIRPFITIVIVYIVVSMSMFEDTDGILSTIKLHMQLGDTTSNFWFGYGFASAAAWIYFALMVIIMGIFILILKPRKEKN